MCKSRESTRLWVKKKMQGPQVAGENVSFSFCQTRICLPAPSTLQQILNKNLKKFKEGPKHNIFENNRKENQTNLFFGLYPVISRQSYSLPGYGSRGQGGRVWPWKAKEPQKWIAKQRCSSPKTSKNPVFICLATCFFSKSKAGVQSFFRCLLGFVEGYFR